MQFLLLFINRIVILIDGSFFFFLFLFFSFASGKCAFTLNYPLFVFVIRYQKFRESQSRTRSLFLFINF